MPSPKSEFRSPEGAGSSSAPSEVVVGVEEGLKGDSAINLDHVQTVPKRLLKHYVGSVGAEKMAAVCEALNIAVACDLDAGPPAAS